MNEFLRQLADSLNALHQGPRKVRVRSFFVYPVPVSSLAPGASDTQQVQIDSATDFYWIKTAYWAENNAAIGGQTDATRIVPSVDAQIQTSGSDKSLFNGFTPVPEIAGTGAEPFVLPMPMKLERASTIRFDYLSRESALTINLRLALIGWKDYGEMLEADARAA